MPYLFVLFLLSFGCQTVVRGESEGDRAVGKIVRNWQWSNYWFKSTALGSSYIEGRIISAVVFWSKNSVVPINGMCSVDLGLCVTYSGFYFDPKGRRMLIPKNASAQNAAKSFVESGFQDDEYLTTLSISPLSFVFETRVITLPKLVLPKVIDPKLFVTTRVEAERAVKVLSCQGNPKVVKTGCTGYFTFSNYREEDPYWFVYRSCSSSCVIRGDAVMELTRSDRRWEATSRGLIDRPDEVTRLKFLIEGASMFSIEEKLQEH